MDLPIRQGHDTIYLCAIDKDGNIASLIQSILRGFRLGPGARWDGFRTSQPRGHCSRWSRIIRIPWRRGSAATHIIPGFMEKDGVRIGFGIMGGFQSAPGHAQFVANIADFDSRFRKHSMRGVSRN
jgi:gamma-glutamyltranspeptidase/glutathione hydrolase